MKNIRLGDVLIEFGYITAEQLNAALAYQKEHRDLRVGQALQELGYVNERQVLQALAKRLQIRMIDIEHTTVDVTAVEKVPQELAQKYDMLPIAQSGHTLTIAATNGDVSGTLADTEFKIVGIVRTSYYFSVDRESATIGDGTVALKMYVGEESFSQEAYSEIFATVAGAQALEEDGYFRANCRRIIETREYVSAELQKRGFALTDSQANFLFAKGCI